MPIFDTDAKRVTVILIFCGSAAYLDSLAFIIIVKFEFPFKYR